MTNQRWILVGLGLMVVGLTMVGCKPANPLIGKWTMTQNIFGMTVTQTREFRADGTETMSSGGPVAMGSEMTYTADGGKLTESATSITLGGKTTKISISQQQPNSPRSVSETYTVNGNTLVITNSMGGRSISQTYSREQSQ